MRKVFVPTLLVALFFMLPGAIFAQTEGEGGNHSILQQIFIDPIMRVVDEIGTYIAVQPSTEMLAGVSYTGPLCPASVVDGIPGIGDGCSLEYKGFDLSYIPEIGIFKGTFTGACNNHDKCYTTLGKTGEECNAQFLSEMKSACDDKYNKYLQPAERSACRHSADLYKAGVDAFLKEANPIPEMQAAAYMESMRLKAAYDAGKCVTNPERTTLYSAGLIQQINNAFTSGIGRSPTMSEFLGALHMFGQYEFPGYFISHRSWWDEYLPEYAKFRSWYKPPQVAWTREEDMLVVTNPDPTLQYEWNVGGYPKSSETSIYVGTANPPKYDTFKPVRGYIKATAPRGFTNISIIDISLLVRGWCSSKPGNPCKSAIE